ncbi:MAG: M23 family metallopeptidase [Betaproteobacteria bacterium]|nr:M23 family metallopeptidase [Betaproteobacteria bacterium]
MTQSFFGALRASVAEYAGWCVGRWLEFRSNPPHVSTPVRVAALLVSGTAAAAAFGVAPMIADEAPPPVHTLVQELALPQLPQQAQAIDDADTTVFHTVRNTGDDTFGGLLAKLGIQDTEATRYLRTGALAQQLLSRNTRFVSAETRDDGSLESLRLRSLQSALGTDGSTVLASETVVTRTAQGFTTQEAAVPLQRQVQVARGVIRYTLFGAADEAGLPDSVTTQLADVFSGDIDFRSDLRRGDEFQVAYEVYTLDGEPVRAGRLLAARFVNAGHAYQAVWYQPQGATSGGYYSFDGKSLKRAFLRDPVQFTRISSGYGMRLHPFSHQWKQHKGVDFAAPMGTPIRAASDGVIRFAGTQRGYGNVIMIDHRGGITTVYGHMRNFAGGVHVGEHVDQGDVIGYVGQTGWATGPHLHYEFREHGVTVNPMTVALPDAAPVAAANLPQFEQVSQIAQHRLALATQIVAASAR